MPCHFPSSYPWVVSQERSRREGFLPKLDAAKIKAVVKNGVLTVTLPKKPEAAAQVKKIEVKKE